MMQRTNKAAVTRPGSATDAVFVTAGSIVLDFHIVPVGLSTGNKHEARITGRLGGAAVNAGVYGVANGLSTAVVGAQRTGWGAAICRELARELGLRPILAERDTDGPGVSAITPNGQPGKNDIYSQRMAPLTVNELRPEMGDALGTARLVLVGPMRCTNDVRELLSHVAALAPQAFLAWMPHPSQLGDPSFPLLARRFDYVQVNAVESREIDGAVNDVRLNARRLSFLAGEETAVAVTNGPDRGWLWADGHWLPIDPVPVPAAELVDDTGCGDSFAGAFLVSWRLLGLGVCDAIHYAAEAAAETARQVGVSQPLPYRPVSVLA